MTKTMIDPKMLLSLTILMATVPLSCADDDNNDGPSDTGSDRVELTVSLEASRETCVAPCFVRFDGTGTTSSSTTSPFHELSYEWEFGDNSSGVWPRGAAAQSGSPKSRNKAIGALAAHVFDPERYGDAYDEDCGLGPNSCKSFEVTLTVNHGVTNDSRSVTIAVTDPDVFFGDTTACLSTGSDFADCPTGDSANHFQIGVNPQCDDWDDCVMYGLQFGYKRVLSKRGDSFNADDTVGSLGDSFNPGTTHLGAFGSGNSPIIQTTALAVFLSWPDVRVDSLDFRGLPGGTLQEIPTFAVQFSNISHGLLYRCSLRDYVNLLIHSASTSGTNGIVENVIGPTLFDQGAKGFLGDGKNLSLLGNQIFGIDGNTRGHQLYFQGGNKLLVSHNDIGPSPEVNEGIGLYQADEGSSQYALISDNYLTHNTGEATISGGQLGYGVPSNGPILRDVIIESNFATTAGGRDGRHIIRLGFTQEVTIRNNLFALIASPMLGLQVYHLTNDEEDFAAKTIRVYNNSVFTSDDHMWQASGSAIFSFASEAVRDVDVRNNLMWSATSSEKPVFIDCGGTTNCTESSNWDRRDGELSENPYTSAAPSGPADFKLHGSNAEPVDAGEDLPAVLTDFADEPRSSPIDIGAFEFSE